MFDEWKELSKLSRPELLKDRGKAGFERIVRLDGAFHHCATSAMGHPNTDTGFS